MVNLSMLKMAAKFLKKQRKEDFNFASVDKLGTVTVLTTAYLQKHIDAVINYPLVNEKRSVKKNYKVVVDVINSTGALFVPTFVESIGC